MFKPSGSIPRNSEQEWRSQLNRFVKSNEKELAALAWGLRQEWQNEDTLGIDLQPKPHFVACSRAAIEKLNQNVNHQLREVLGILDGYDRELEVVIIGIGKGQINLFNFRCDPPPSICFEEVGKDLDKLIKELEERLAAQISL